MAKRKNQEKGTPQGHGGQTSIQGQPALPRRRPHRTSQAVNSFGYWDGIARNNHRAQFPHLVGDSELTHTAFSRQELISASRKLYDNDGVIKGAINTVADHAFPLIPKATTENSEWNKAAEKYFTEWATTRADITGDWDFERMQRQLSIAIDRDGDQLPIFTTHFDGAPAVQLIESHRIANGTIRNPDSSWSEGVKQNAVGRNTRYAITTRKGITKPIPAFSALLLRNTDRVRQRRGMPLISFALAHLKDKREILGHEKLAVKYLSSLMPYFTSSEGELEEEEFERIDANPTPAEETEGEEESPPDEIEKAAKFVKRVLGTEVPVRPPGVDLKQLDHDRPSSTFNGFLDYLLRDYCIGYGFPFEWIINPKGITGPGHRSILSRVDKGLTSRRKLLAPFCRRTWAYVIGLGIDRKELPPQKGWYKCRLQPPRKLSIDAGRDAKADRDDVASGLMSRQEYYANRDRDWEDETDQIYIEEKKIISQAKQLAEELDIPLTLALDRLSTPTANGTFATDSATTQTPSKNSEDEDDDS